MISFFVENRSPKKPEPDRSSPSPFVVFWIGLLLIFLFTLTLLPFGVYWPLSNSIWVFLFFFLPLVFLGIHLTRTYGYTLLIAVVISLVSGGNVLLFLGDVIGYKLGLTSQFDVLPENISSHLGYRYLYLKEFYLDEKESGSFRSPLLVRRRSGGSVYGPIVTFQYKRIRPVSGKETKIPLYAICYSKDSGHCQISSLYSGGILLRESLWESENQTFPEKAVFFIWKDRLDREMETKGMYSILFWILLLLLWGVVVYFPTNWFGSR